MHKVKPRAVFVQDPAPSTINPVVHETCGTLTGLLCDVTDRFEFQFCFCTLATSYGSLCLNKSV